MKEGVNLEKWGQRYNLSLFDVWYLKSLVNKRVKAATKAMNGDPHPECPKKSKEDKNINAKLWDKECDKTDKLILSVAKSCGFDGVDFGVGLYPTFSKGDETCIMIP